MNILVIDTATEACSAALSYQGQTLSRFEVCPQQHSQRLLPMVDELLADAGIGLTHLDALAFGRGPGSFTGVRIATGMIQGLAMGADLPVVPISTLATMAQQALDIYGHDRVIAAIDARMDEVYVGRYKSYQGIIQLVDTEQVIAPELAVPGAELSGWYGVGTGWQAYPQLDPNKDISPLTDILYPAAEYMLPLARQAMKLGQALAVEQVEPVYLRDKVTWKKLPGRE